MGKKCIICNAEAKLQIKDTSDYHCHDCAEENFGDLAMLIEIEQDAQRLKRFIENRLEDENDEN